jgi:hypothetical protein
MEKYDIKRSNVWAVHAQIDHVNHAIDGPWPHEVTNCRQ